MIGVTETVVFYVVVFVLLLMIWAAVLSKAGYSGWYSLLMVVPIVNLIALIVFASREWPIQRELRELRSSVGLGSEEDAFSLYKEAAKLEAKGDIEDGLNRYREVLARFQGTAAARDAEISIKGLSGEKGGGTDE